RYAYDAADNLIDATRDATASKVLSDLLTRFRDTGYTYDGFDQLCRKTRDGMAQDFVYDDEGRMVRASGQSRSGFHSARYAYDALGRRTGKTTSRTEERVARRQTPLYHHHAHENGQMHSMCRPQLRSNVQLNSAHAESKDATNA
ncbi:hypothetical protein VOM14_24680, partial [Paraburkholderia sp. MPAMCS5]|nr:hypothetical protein [Paraburkholderia sp. MPAMCS5]